MCVILLIACWTGDVKVKGSYSKVMMNGQTQYFADLMGRDDIQITKGVHDTLKKYFADFGTDYLYCDFEYMPGSDIHDQVTYCDEVPSW